MLKDTPDVLPDTPPMMMEDSHCPSREQTWSMFDRIAHRYDLLNRLLSMGQDVAWRRHLTRHLPDNAKLHVLDLATGTADILLAIHAQSERIVSGIGVDMSPEMLRYGRQKVVQAVLSDILRLVRGNALRLPFRDGQFQAVTMAFGIRNVLDVDMCLREILRVLKPGGRTLILEFSLPEYRAFRTLYLFYFRHILPRLGGLISGDVSAYRYLNETVETFPYGDDFCELMCKAGFSDIHAYPLTLGIATLYQGDKG